MKFLDIVMMLVFDFMLIEIFCLVYDIGYFLFGYGGEIVFNYMMY